MHFREVPVWIGAHPLEFFFYRLPERKSKFLSIISRERLDLKVRCLRERWSTWKYESNAVGTIPLVPFRLCTLGRDGFRRNFSKFRGWNRKDDKKFYHTDRQRRSRRVLWKNEGDIATTESKSTGIFLLLSLTGKILDNSRDRQEGEDAPGIPRDTHAPKSARCSHIITLIRTHCTLRVTGEGSCRGEDVHVERRNPLARRGLVVVPDTDDIRWQNSRWFRRQLFHSSCSSWRTERDDES